MGPSLVVDNPVARAGTGDRLSVVGGGGGGGGGADGGGGGEDRGGGGGGGEEGARGGGEEGAGGRARSEVVTTVHSNVLHWGGTIWRGTIGRVSSLFPIFSNFHQ